MKVYTVHLRHSGLDPDRDIVLVKEGFNWLAFLFGPFWALFGRLWLTALGLALFNVAIAGGGAIFGFAQPFRSALALALAVAVGFVANDLKRWTLGRKGFLDTGVVSAPDPESALQRFLDSEPELAGEMAR